MRRFVMVFTVVVLILWAWSVIPSQADDGGITTVIMVRHAEEDRTKEEIPLTDGGRKRALELARVLEKVNISVIYATPTARAKETAGPLARKKGLPIREYNYNGYGELPGVTASFLKEHKGKVVFIAGHSDDVPMMSAIMSRQIGPGKEIQFMNKGIYDTLIILSVPDKGTATVLELKYGEPSVPVAAK